MALHLYSDIDNIPSNIKYIKDNIKYFSEITINKLDKRVNGLLKYTDGAIYKDEYHFTDKFGTDVLWEGLSAGGKTILNIFYNEDCCFDTLECGKNALADLKNISTGNAYPNYILDFDGNDIVDVIVDNTIGYTKYSYWEGCQDFYEEEEEGNGFYYI